MRRLFFLLLICREQVGHASKIRPSLDRFIESSHKRIEDGFRRGEPLGDHLALTQYHYVLWTVGQYGALTGRKLIGGVDWYAVGARALVRTQRKDGSWRDPGGGLQPDPVVATSFAVLFLKRDTPPLQHPK